MRHRSIQSQAIKLAVGTISVGALSGFCVRPANATLTLDLYQQGTTNTTVNLSSGSPTVNFDIVATVTGTDADPTNDGLGGFFAGFQGTGTIQGNLSASLAAPFNASGTQVGTPTSSDGTHLNQIVGINDTSDNWFFAAYRTVNGTAISAIDTLDGTAVGSGSPGAGRSFIVGTLTFTADAATLSGSNSGTLSIIPRYRSAPAVEPALWQEDGVVQQSPAAAAGYPSPLPSTGLTLPYAIGNTISLSAGPQYLKGDMNGDGSFNNFDITPFVLALTDPNTYKTNYPAMTSIYQQVGDMNNDGSFNNFDITPFVTALTSPHAAEQMAAALASVPEPASVGLMGLGMLVGLARRRRSR